MIIWIAVAAVYLMFGAGCGMVLMDQYVPGKKRAVRLLAIAMIAVVWPFFFGIAKAPIP